MNTKTKKVKGEELQKAAKKLSKRAEKVLSKLGEFTASKWSAQVKEITPEQAALVLLERNTNKGINATNRTLKKRNVRFLGRAIAEKSWKRHAGNIKFDTSGTLIDGQHRMDAIAKSGKTVEVIVEVGCDNNTSPAIDQGDNRTLTHAVQFGRKFKTLAPSSIGWFTTRAVTILTTEVTPEGNKVPKGTLAERSKGYSAKIVEKTIAKHMAALKFLKANRSSKKGFARPAVIGPIASFVTSDPEKGKEFYNDLIDASVLEKPKSNAARMFAKFLSRYYYCKDENIPIDLGVYSSRGKDEAFYLHRNLVKAMAAFKLGKNIKYTSLK